MKLYRVVVKCTYQRKKPSAPFTIRKAVLVEAENIDAAMKAGIDWADSNAEGDKKWIAFEGASAATMMLPLEL